MQTNKYAWMGILCGCLAIGTWVYAEKPEKAKDPDELPQNLKPLQGKWVAVEIFYLNWDAAPQREILHMRYDIKKFTVELDFAGSLGVMSNIYKRGDELVRLQPMRVLLNYANTEPVVCDIVGYKDFLRGSTEFRLPCIVKVEGDKLYYAEYIRDAAPQPPKTFDIRKESALTAVAIFERLKEGK